MAKPTKTFDQYMDDMDTNGYSHTDQKAFENNHDEVCYIPENAENLKETFSRNDLLKLCEEFVEENGLKKVTAENVLEELWARLEWTFPSTELDQMLQSYQEVEEEEDEEEDTRSYVCSNCGGGFKHDEMTFGEDNDLCNDCAP